jgi:YHS domain-containing protein
MALKNKKPANFYVVLSASVIVLAVALAAAILVRHPNNAGAGQGRITDRSRICMLQDTVQPRSGLTYVYNGKKYYLCCGGCLAAFQRDAAIHSHATDPIDGQSVDKADAPAYAYKGRAYFFSSVANMTKFTSDPDKFVASASSQAAER